MDVSGAAPTRLIHLIRHAEKPDDADGVDSDGRTNPHSLTPRGWQRSGALGMLFTGRSGPGATPLVRPDRLLCPDYGSATSDHRAYQTLLGVAGLTGLPIASPFSLGSEDELAAHVMGGSFASVVICWEHHRLPAIAAALPTATPPPAEWPGHRFDLIWRFALVGGAGSPRYEFAQLPQHVLGGDSDDG